MANNNRYTVGLLVANITDPFSNNVAKGALLAAEDFDVNLVIVPGKYIDRDDQNNLRDCQYEYQYNALFSHVSSENLDYLVVCIGTIAYTSDTSRRIEILEQLGKTPILTVADKLQGYDYIVYDNKSGIRDAVNFLVNKSHCKKIAMMAGDLNNYECMERFNAYRSALAENNIDFDENLVAISDVSENCYYEANALIEHYPEIDGIVCANDAIASTVYKILREKGKVIGKDVCVTGFDDQPFSAKLDPPLATVRADAGMLGYKAIEKAVAFLKGQGKSYDYKEIKTTFVPRGSCCDDMEALMSSYDIFSGSYSVIAEKVMTYLFDKPISNSVYQTCYEFIKKSVKILVDNFIDSDPPEDFLVKAKEFINKNFLKSIESFGMVYYIESVVELVDCCYKWVDSKTRPENRFVLKKLFDYLNKKINMFIVSAYKGIEDERTEHTHLSNLVVRETLMLENNLKDIYAYILRKLPYVGVNTGYLFLFKEPVLYRRGTFFPKDMEWEFKSFHYGFDPEVIPKEEQNITPYQVFNNDRLPINRRYSLVMIDLYSNEYQYGMALCEPKNADFFNDVELVTYQLSAAVKIIDLLKSQDQMLTELNTKNQVLENMSMIDELTGIFNRRGFYSTANQFIRDSRVNGRKLIVAYADMDNLKMVNDAYGHIEGDFSLKSLANCLKSVFGKNSIVGRVGGDEFVAIAVEENCGGMDDIRIKKEAYIQQLNKSSQKPYRINMSIGMYECVCHNSYDLKDAIDKADDLLYQQKQKRKKMI